MYIGVFQFRKSGPLFVVQHTSDLTKASVVYLTWSRVIRAFGTDGYTVKSVVPWIVSTVGLWWNWVMWIDICSHDIA